MSKYTGWISNVSGELFFHLTAPWNYRLDRIVGDMVYFDEKIHDTRYIIVTLLADFRDYNDDINVPIENTTEYTRIVFIGQTQKILDNGVERYKFVGNYFSLLNKNKLICEDDEKVLLRKLKSHIDNYIQFNSKLDKADNTEYNDAIAYLTKEVKEDWIGYKHKSIYKRSIAFEINYDGFIDLWHDDKAIFTHKSFYQDFLQAYYFIKFIFHNHVHHQITSEDILDIYTTPQDNELDKKKYARNLIKDIKKYIAEVRNRNKSTYGSKTTYVELTGMIAYANTMMQQLKEKKYITGIFLRKEKIYFDNLSLSIKSHISNNQNNQKSTLSKVITTFMQVQLFIFSILTPYFIIKSRAFVSKDIFSFIDKEVIPTYIILLALLFFIVMIFDRVRYGENSFIIKLDQKIKHISYRFLKEKHMPSFEETPIFTKIIHNIQKIERSQSKKKYFWSKILFGITLFFIIVTILYWV